LGLADNFGTVLRRVRKQALLSQEQLGFEAGLERNFISMLELGQRQPTLTTIEKISVALKMTASELIAQVEAESTNS
jgi:transcriptional regulator with XRE-family HTH domain